MVRKMEEATPGLENGREHYRGPHPSSPGAGMASASPSRPIASH